MADPVPPETKAVAKRPRAATPAAQVKQQSKSKTAVVVIHGMGEQRPLETLRGFVETVYRRDTALASKPPGKDGLSISVVPDDLTGSGELRRITTLNDGPQKRTDFFEFYWADLMDGTPADMVRGWIQTLLLRSPFRLPRSAKVIWAWLILWALALVMVAAGFIAVHPNLSWFVLPLPVQQFLGALRPVAVTVLVVAALVLLVFRVLRAWGDLYEVAVRLPLVLLVVGLALGLLPAEMVETPRFWAVAITAGVAWGMNALVAPYAGDVVRYVRATPSTVERRRLVRERGLALLEALHDKRAGAPVADGGDDAASPPLYDRIVIVGHSLGTIVGYDILQLFWEKRGPTHHQSWDPKAEGVQGALIACDHYVKAAQDTNTPFDAVGFEAARSNLSKVMAQQNPGWRISDFITLGSPLTHAEFLLADTPREVEAAFVERRFATAPPRPDPLRDGSMLFPVIGPPPVKRPPRSQREIGEPLFPHFAAQFAAVKWTNIYDECSNPLFGDLVSGKLGDSFGRGIVENDVKIRRPGPFGRLFTHTRYWAWHPNYEPSAAKVEAGEALSAAQAAQKDLDEEKARAALQQLFWHNVPEHIRLLRQALRLGT